MVSFFKKRKYLRFPQMAKFDSCFFCVWLLLFGKGREEGGVDLCEKEEEEEESLFKGVCNEGREEREGREGLA